MAEQKIPARPESYDKKVALVLQGGGALGSYQAGVYEALSTSQYLPDGLPASQLARLTPRSSPATPRTNG
jgi:predicted acylesterase/phospholipase RssA